MPERHSIAYTHARASNEQVWDPIAFSSAIDFKPELRTGETKASIGNPRQKKSLATPPNFSAPPSVVWHNLQWQQ
jgi:hypothetical protein